MEYSSVSAFDDLCLLQMDTNNQENQFACEIPKTKAQARQSNRLECWKHQSRLTVIVAPSQAFWYNEEHMEIDSKPPGF